MTRPTAASHGLRNAVVPAAVLGVIVVLNVTLGAEHPISSLLVIVPLLAANLVGPGATLGFGALCAATWAVLGLHGAQFDDATRASQIVRGVGLWVAIAIAVAASALRQRREERLRQVERVAEVAQRAIIAPIGPRLGPVLLAARYESSTESAKVGGDFYATAATPFGVRILLGDVQGKGLDAVRMANDVIGAFRERAGEEADLVDLLERLNAAVCRTAVRGEFVTAALAQVSATGELEIANAGHLPPVLVRDGQCTALLAGRVRPPLGLAGRAQPTRVALRPDDRVLLYTDGITEARRPTDRAFRLDDDVLRDAALGTDPADTTDRIFAGLLDWTGGRLTDDAAALTIQYAPLDVPAMTLNAPRAVSAS